MEPGGQVTSSGPHHGACFMYPPVAMYASWPRVPLKPRICLVMDPSPLRDLLSEILSQGEASCQATPRDDPVRDAARSHPHLIVLDFGWGSTMDDRLRTVRALRADGELRSVPLLGLTTDLRAARRHRTQLKELYVRLLQLPVDLHTLETRVAALLVANGRA